MLANQPPPSIPVIRAELITRRLKLAGADGCRLHVIATGRTGSGKTTIGNRLLGVDYFLSHGGQDCTREVNLVRFPGGLSYADLPGACSDDQLENVNRVSLGLAQVPDFPTVTELTIAEYVGGQPPARSGTPAAAAPSVCPPPDLIFYVLAAHMQFLTDDRRYLKDLLTRHRRVLYVLNIFANKPPTEANVRDVVGKLAEVHRQAAGAAPRVVAVDCRTGDGLAELLSAARDMLPEPGGGLLADLIADQERQTPHRYARAFGRYLAGQASAAAGLQAGAVAEHPIHRITAGLLDTVEELRACSSPARLSCATRYHSLVAAALGAAATLVAPPALAEFASRCESTVLRPALLARSVLCASATATVREAKVEWRRRVEQMRTTESALDVEARELNRKVEALEKAVAERDEAITGHKAQKNQLESRQLAHSNALEILRGDSERYSEQVDEYNDVIDRINAGLSVSASTRSALEHEQGRLDRTRERLNRRVAELNREGDALQKALDRFNDRVRSLQGRIDHVNTMIDDFKAGAAAHRSRRAEVRRTALRLSRQAAADEWAEQQFTGAFNQSIGEIDAAGSILAKQLHRLSELARLAGRPGFNKAAAEYEVDQLGAVAATSSSRLAQALTRARRLWAGFVLNRAANELLLDGAIEHFDDEGDGAHRGTTYRALGLDGAAFVLAAGQLAIFGRNVAVEYPPLFRSVGAALGELVDPVAEHLTAAFVESRPDVLRPEFAAGVAGLEVFTR